MRLTSSDRSADMAALRALSLMSDEDFDDAGVVALAGAGTPSARVVNNKQPTNPFFVQEHPTHLDELKKPGRGRDPKLPNLKCVMLLRTWKKHIKVAI